MIIVEGFDCSGKSTLVRHLAEMLQWSEHHIGGPTRDEDDTMNCLARCRRRMMERCIQDRVTHISESVYAMLDYPKKAALALNSIREVACAELVIYCRPPTEVMLELLEDHEKKEHDDPQKLEIVMETAPTLIRLYDTIMNLVQHHMGCRLITYDFTKVGNYDEVMATIKRKFA